MENDKAEYVLAGCYGKEEKIVGLCDVCEFKDDEKKCEAWRVVYDSTSLYKQKIERK